MPISVNSTNASGACSIALENTFFTSIVARWVVPNVLQEGPVSVLDSWIGLAKGSLHTRRIRGKDGFPPITIIVDGGIEADMLIQLGVQTLYAPGNVNGDVSCATYYQIVPFPAGPDACDGYMNLYFPVNPGDSLTATICNNPTQAEVFFILANETTNAIMQTVSIPYSSIPGIQNFQPNWAGWMVSNDIPLNDNFANYGSVIFDSISATPNQGPNITPSHTLNLKIGSGSQALTISKGSIEGTVIVCERG